MFLCPDSLCCFSNARGLDRHVTIVRIHFTPADWQCGGRMDDQADGSPCVLFSFLLVVPTSLRTQFFHHFSFINSFCYHFFIFLFIIYLFIVFLLFLFHFSLFVVYSVKNVPEQDSSHFVPYPGLFRLAPGRRHCAFRTYRSPLPIPEWSSILRFPSSVIPNARWS